MNIALRQAMDRDKVELYALYKDAMQGHIETIWGWDEEWQRDDFEKSFASCDTQVVEVDSELAGYIQTESRENNLHIRMIVLGQGFRYKGVGKMLINRMKLKAAHSGRALQLSVFKVNNRAFKFYKSNNFAIKSEDSIWYLMEQIGSDAGAPNE